MGIVTYFLTLVDVQDEISMGFDRLVAMASEVDKRRKSAENSPAHNSPSCFSRAGSGPPIGAKHFLRERQEMFPGSEDSDVYKGIAA